VLAAAPWIFVSDIHLNPADRRAVPVSQGRDTNAALLASAIAEMRRVDPKPPVVVITGDFLAHRFDYAKAAATMGDIARLFDRAFPQAQFVITLGNEDAGCADYGFALNSAFARSVVAAWTPLVDRNGAAPSFAKTFASEGFYVAKLPVARTEAVVLDDVFWSPFYHACGASGAQDGAARILNGLRSALSSNAEHRWVIAHIPPGIDTYASTQIGHGFLAVPYLQAAPAAEFLRLLQEPGGNVSLALVAHSHRFAYRIAAATGEQPIPILLVPAISPIYKNAPAFLTVDVVDSGLVRTADVHALLGGRWQDIGGTRSLGLDEFSGPQLIRLQERLAGDPAARAVFARLYVAGATPEINERNWRSYWCAAVEFTPDDFRRCTGAGGFGILTGRAVWLAVLIALVLGALFVASRGRRAVRGQP
jgi:sphingomyelin phosphodiesterase acid-like 3